ncbi:MAG TPA: sigma-70 family RNA polymerase sigma factor [Kofleriaceae bacterium]|nr:sigma-70 family RNA polymerase sigma factor [Kofleriaceae bacterium]
MIQPPGGKRAPAVEAGIDHAGPPSSSSPELAFVEAYRVSVEFVRFIVRRHGIPAADREDVVQDVFVVAHRRWAQLASMESLHAWLRGIAVRICWNYRRARRRSNELLTLDPEDPDAQPGGAERMPPDELERREDLQWLMRAMDRLDAKQRSALVLTQLEQRSAVEVSRMTGLSPNTVASRLRAAMQDLRRAALARQTSIHRLSRLAR